MHYLVDVFFTTTEAVCIYALCCFLLRFFVCSDFGVLSNVSSSRYESVGINMSVRSFSGVGQLLSVGAVRFCLLPLSGRRRHCHQSQHIPLRI